MQQFLKLRDPTPCFVKPTPTPAEVIGLIKRADAMEREEAEWGEEVTKWSEQDLEDKRYRLELVEDMRRLAGLRGPVKQAEQLAKDAEVERCMRLSEGAVGVEAAAYKALFIVPSAFEHHVNLLKWVTTDFLDMRVATQQAHDFDPIKFASTSNRMYICAKIMLATGITNLLSVEPTRALASAALRARFHELFGKSSRKAKPFDLGSVPGVKGAIVKMFRVLFGTRFPKDWSRDVRDAIDGRPNARTLFHTSHTAKGTVIGGVDMAVVHDALAIAQSRYASGNGGPGLDALLQRQHGTTEPSEFLIMHVPTRAELNAAKCKHDRHQAVTERERELLVAANLWARPLDRLRVS
jgi:hypothetical protein